MLFIFTERYSDFNSMIEQYEKEMRKLFEESRRANGTFDEPAAETAVFPEDAPEVPQFLQKEQDNTEIPEYEEKTQQMSVAEEPSVQNTENKEGSIIAEVTTAKGAVPLAGVTVVIDRFDQKDPMGRKELIAVRETNENGRTSAVSVPAEEKELSLEPGQSDPFSTYYVSVWEKGYTPIKNRPADVFSDEVSILKIDLVPNPENLSAGGMKNG